MNDKKRSAISYCRKSIKVNGKSIRESVGYQQQVINEYAEKNDLHIIKTYSDIGYSGKNVNRPELKEMLRFLETRDVEVDEILFYSIDRFGRDLVNNIEAIQEIVKHVKKVYFVTEGISTDSNYFKMFFLLLTGAAQSERDRLLKRLNDGRKAKIINRKSFDGNYKPLGLVKDEKSERLIPASKENTNNVCERREIEIIQLIFYLYLFNTSLRKIATVLNENYGKTRRRVDWTYKSVQYILQNPIYCGFLTGTLNKRERYFIPDSNVTNIIDPLIHIMVVKKLELETRGRKKLVCGRDPYLTCCEKCFEPFVEIENRLFCHRCATNVEVSIIKPFIKNEIFGKTSIKKVKEIYKENLFNRIKERLIDNNHVLNKLNEHLEIIKSLNNDKVLRNKMIKFNLDQQHEYIKQKMLLEGIISCLKKNDLNSLHADACKKVQNYCIECPKLIMINIEAKVVNFLFYKNIFTVDCND